MPLEHKPAFGGPGDMQDFHRCLAFPVAVPAGSGRDSASHPFELVHLPQTGAFGRYRRSRRFSRDLVFAGDDICPLRYDRLAHGATNGSDPYLARQNAQDRIDSHHIAVGTQAGYDGIGPHRDIRAMVDLLALVDVGNVQLDDRRLHHLQRIEQGQRGERKGRGIDDEIGTETVERRGSAARGGQPYFIRRSDALVHVCLHAHYTLAQVINMLRHLGIENLPDRMLIQLAWQETD